MHQLFQTSKKYLYRLFASIMVEAPSRIFDQSMVECGMLSKLSMWL